MAADDLRRAFRPHKEQLQPPPLRSNQATPARKLEEGSSFALPTIKQDLPITPLYKSGMFDGRMDHASMKQLLSTIESMNTSISNTTTHAGLAKLASRQWVHTRQSSSSGVTLPWRSAAILDQWVQREARPISLRQLTVFGRTLTESRLISSANYVRTELPTRLAHRLRDLQSLPYAVIANPHMSHVYNLYYSAFDSFRRIPVIKTVEDNEKYCRDIKTQLSAHMTVIPKLVMGVLEIQDLLPPEATDKLMNTMLRSRISRRVIAEQHIALTDNFTSPWRYPDAQHSEENQNDFVGEVFLRCNAKEVIDRCAKRVQLAARHVYGPSPQIPEVIVQGHLGATFPYIPSHLEYMIGELLRNSVQAVVEHHTHKAGLVPPIEVLICETPQHVIFRFSDKGGGIAQDILPFLWSFVKGPRRQTRLEALNQVPQLSATLQELQLPDGAKAILEQGLTDKKENNFRSSLSSLSGRPPNLRLGIGLPMSRVYAEYWAGSLELHSLEGYGVDAFLEISKLGNKNEQLTTRATMDAL